jgi:citrate synthase
MSQPADARKNSFQRNLIPYEYGECTSILCERITAQLPAWRERVARLLKEHGSFAIAKVTVDQIYGGIRGVPIQVSDISYVDPYEGIRIRGYTIPELLEKLPRPKGAEFPLMGGLFYLLMANSLPTQREAELVEDEWKQRAELPGYVYETINSMPLDMHPMALFSMGILALQRDSVFSQEYTRGVRKPDYWKSYLEDSLNLMAKLPPLAAYIYNRKYRNGENVAPDPDLDWSGNFAHLIGKGDDLQYRDLSRLFFLIHSDHEGGNVSAHAAHLVSSALSDIYYSCSAGMNGLAGPLHGLANQECLRWIQELRAQFDHFPSREELEKFAREYVASGQVIPGYGHAVLRATDPRFTAQYEFAQKYLPNDELFRLVSLVYEVVPDVLRDLGKVKNPWPNVDAINGTLQYHYGVTEIDFYTVLFGVSRCMGLCAHATWARALGKPIERPKSLTTAMLEEMVKEDQEARLSQPSE